MNDATPAGPNSLEEMRRSWLSHAGAAFDLMFHAEHQADLVAFDQREARARELGRDLTNWLIEKHVNADEMAQLPADKPIACPKCGQPAWCKTEPDEAPPSRRLTGLSGEVELKRDQWTCTACRTVFFPPGQ